MSLISEFGDVLHMSSFRRTSDVLFSHTWRNACSWATQVVTRAGSSTTQQHKGISSQNVQNSTNASFLDLQNTRQHRPLISCHLVHCLWPLCRLLCPCLIWRGIVMLRSLHLAFLMLSLLELPFGNPNDYARSGHLHSTATVPESSSSLSYLHCITYDESCLLSQRFRG